MKPTLLFILLITVMLTGQQLVDAVETSSEMAEIKADTCMVKQPPQKWLR